MSETVSFKKYRIKGLDCGHCAAEIERELQKLDGFEQSAVSFSTSTVTIPEGQEELAQKTISAVEPEARLLPAERASGGTGSPGEEDEQRGPFGLSRALWQVVRIAVALTLTLLGLLFREPLAATPFSIGEYALFIPAYLLVGWGVLASAGRNILRGRVFDEMFLMTVATLGAIAVNEVVEAVAVMLFYAVGEYVQDRAVDRSRRSISALMDLRPDYARVVTGESTEEVDPDLVSTGAIIEVRPGERVPLDGEVLSGESAVDTSALTGESVPRSVSPGESVLAGFINSSATVRLRVDRPFAESSVSRILELVEEAANRKAPTERFVSRLARVYTPIVVGAAAAIAFLPPLFLPGAALGEWVYRALVMLVISCPCALVVSIPLGYFGGIGGASRNGILVKGGNYLDSLTDLGAVVLDKTGTLTHGTFSVTACEARGGFSSEELLRLAALAESHSSHPIARSIRDAWSGMLDEEVTEVEEEKGYGVTALVAGRKLLAGSERLLRRHGIEPENPEAPGTVVHVAVDGAYAGYLLIADTLKEDTPGAVARIRELGVARIVMLTGDNSATAAQVAEAAGIDSYFAGLLPEEKVSKVEEIAASLPEGKRLAFVGDGINDAPVLMRSDIGIAMGALGSDAAIEAADVVLMDDRMSGVSGAISVARHTRSVVVQNIVLALLVKAVFLALGAVGIATMWEAVIADMGTSLLAVLNATRTLRYSAR